MANKVLIYSKLFKKIAQFESITDKLSKAIYIVKSELESLGKYERNLTVKDITNLLGDDNNLALQALEFIKNNSLESDKFETLVVSNNEKSVTDLIENIDEGITSSDMEDIALEDDLRELLDKAL